MNARGPRVHAPILAFGRMGDALSIAGKPASAWVAEAGGTPLFLYERAFLDQRLALLRAAMPAGLAIHYAVKANPFPPLVGHMASLCDGLDVASAGELALALATGIKPHAISFAGPGKSEAELAEAAKAGVVIVLESEGEMQRLAAIASTLQGRPKVALRVNPDFALKSAGMHMGGGATAFGVDAETAPRLLRALADLPLDFMGLHIFAGSQNLNPEAIIEAQARTLDLARRLSRDFPRPLRWLNIGGGFGVPYFPGDIHLDIAAVGAALAARLAAHKAWLQDAEVVLELGRYLVAEAGVYLTRVIDRKVSRGVVFLVTDGGLHHQLAASGNFGQVVRRNYPLAVATRYGLPMAEEVNIVGRLCTPLDRLGDKVALPRADVGDIIAVFLAGAYGLSASPTGFLSHPAALEMLV
ncbi:MAG: pyridoxal-dependent decarboxylase, exosortase A system-associated [Pseudomonadota bacterium]